MGKHYPSASRKRAAWIKTVALSRQQQQKKNEGREDKTQESNTLERKRKRKKIRPRKTWKRKKNNSPLRDKETNKLAKFFRNLTPSQKLQFIAMCIAAGVKITGILLISLL